MRILQICNKPAFPAVDGGAIAMGNMTRSLLRNGYDVTVLNMVSFKHQSSLADWPLELQNHARIEFAKVDLRIKLYPALVNLFSSRSYHAERFYSKHFEAKLRSLLKKNHFDIILAETVFVMIYHDVLRKYSAARIIIRVHNIEHEIWQTTAEAERNFFKKWYLKLLAKRLKTFEDETLRKADALLTISFSDLEKLRQKHPDIPAENIPLGIDLRDYSDEKATTPPLKIFHLGAMDWIPNQIGIQWFLDEIWKKISEKFSKVQLHLAGRKMPKEFFQLHMRNVIVKSAVDDPLQYMRTKDIMVVPLLSGSGLRVKIIEGMALGKTIITTPIGAAGIECRHGHDIFIADSAAAFVQHLTQCINDEHLRNDVGKNARHLVEKLYSMEAVSAKMGTFINKITNHNI